ncbi:MAG TPA: GNAT family N-acetyltransferase [Terriglobia bacterium]|nr:GNAT family N-acetyltransferase [Terriglobia bacterium]
MNVILIRDFEPGDAAAIIEIQRAAAESSQWLLADYERLSREAGGMVLVAQSPKTCVMIGFLAARLIGEEAELYNLAVAETHRHRGVGRALVQEFHRRLAATGVLQVSCEVRASNAAALNLYRAFGYVRSGLRRGYYASDGEDALLLQCDLRYAAACSRFDLTSSSR